MTAEKSMPLSRPRFVESPGWTRRTILPKNTSMVMIIK
jgi:hypothetical protein